MSELHAENITIVAGDALLVNNVSLQIRSGEMVALLGPNGAGKSSLMRALAGIALPKAGRVIFDERDVSSASVEWRARCMTYLPQQRVLAWPNRVRDIVSLGRFAHGAAMGRLNDSDARIVDKAMQDCEIDHLGNRSADTLSGGEQARMHIARALTAQSKLILADEPVAELDPRHKLSVINVLRQFVQAGGGGLIVLHDLELAARYADRLVFMKDGAIVAEGAPEDVLTVELLANVYGVEASIKNTETGLSLTIERPC